MIACPVCLTEVRSRSRSHTHIWLSSSRFSCDCGRLAYDYISDYWQFSDRFGHPDNVLMLLPDGKLRHLKSSETHYVPENGRAAFVQRFVDRVLTREILES